MYSILDPDPSIVYETDSKAMLPWWRKVMEVMRSSADTMKRLKGFSLAKLNGPYGALLLSRARDIYRKLSDAMGRGAFLQSPSVAVAPADSVDTPPPSSRLSSARSEIKDEDWDSEADTAVGGSWVKGEWVPIIHKKERWWEKGSPAHKHFPKNLSFVFSSFDQSVSRHQRQGAPNREPPGKRSSRNPGQ